MLFSATKKRAAITASSSFGYVWGRTLIVGTVNPDILSIETGTHLPICVGKKSIKINVSFEKCLCRIYECKDRKTVEKKRLAKSLKKITSAR